MRQVPPALQAHLDTGATTLCWCWRITRHDGAKLGFTDHDRDLTFDGTTFEAATGFTASEVRESIGLSVDNLEVDGALRSDRLAADDLEAGLYDDAAVEIFRVNWIEPAQRLLIRAGSLGEVRRDSGAFTAEIRGVSHYLQQEAGRSFQYSCDAILGDSRCGINLALPAFRGTGSIVAAQSPTRFTASGLAAYASDWFSRGLVSWTGGPNLGRSVEVKLHTVIDGDVVLELWQRPASVIAAGHAFQITAGCDKRIETCRARFANAANFRGFPHMPGNDFVTGYPNSDDANNDGRSLFL